jgi:hypothetical protein
MNQESTLKAPATSSTSDVSTLRLYLLRAMYTFMAVVLVPLAMPWGYVFNQFLRAPGDKWGKHVTVSASKEQSPSPLPAS